MLLEAYVKQVRDCCLCFECADDIQWENAVITALEDWGNLTCGNWIDEHTLQRRVPLSKRCDNCCPNVYRINLPEAWVQKNTVEVKVRAWYGIEVREIDVLSTFDEYTHDLVIDLSNAIDCCNQCTTYDLIVDYTVGTQEIPAELCRWFCAVAKVYMELEEVDCATCGSADSVAIIEVDGQKDLSATIKSLAVAYFSNVIEKYSLCFLKSIEDWTVVR